MDDELIPEDELFVREPPARLFLQGPGGRPCAPCEEVGRWGIHKASDGSQDREEALLRVGGRHYGVGTRFLPPRRTRQHGGPPARHRRGPPPGVGRGGRRARATAGGAPGRLGRPARRDPAEACGWLRERGIEVPPELERPQPPVVLQDLGRSILVLGQPVKGMKGGGYRAIEALVKDYADGGPGLTRHELNRGSGLKEARKHLEHLCDEARAGGDARLWRQVLGYRPGALGENGKHFLQHP